MNHDEPPEIVHDVPKDVIDAARRITNSAYGQYVSELSPYVKGAVVVDCHVGQAGFALVLDGKNWVLSHLDGGTLCWVVGSGRPTSRDLERLSVGACADGGPRLSADLPYADEACDIAAEVSRSVGHQITGLAIGETCFNFCFSNGYELETMLVNDDRQELALRVFWERWS